MRFSVPFLLAGIVLGCGSSGEGSPAPVTPPATPPTTPETDRATEESARPAPAAARGERRVRYALARHVARAELHQGDAHVIDFGVPGAAKYTLGGWHTRVRSSIREQQASGVTATSSVIENVTGSFIVPIEREGATTLRLRARALRDGRLTVYLGQETIGHARLPIDGTYDTVSIPLPPERLRVGENMLQLRIAATGALPGIENAGIVLDWARVGPSTDAHGLEGPPPPESLAQIEGEHATLRIPSGWTLGYTMEIPEGAHLTGTAAGDGDLEVVAVRDGAPPTTVGRVTPGAFDLDLGSLRGETARLELRSGGSLVLSDPSIVTFDGTSVRAQPRMRNVLIYLTDTLRADKLRPYREDSRVQTPRLDAWAQTAATMLRGHSQENWTKPSVATLLSGLFPWEHQATSEEAIVPESVQLLSERFGRSMHSGAFIANGFCSDRFGFRQGWGSFTNYIREGRRTQAEFIAADVLSWLDARPADRPFFLYVHTVDPHVPYLPPAEHLRLYDPEPYEGIVDFNRDRELLERVKSRQITLNERDRTHLEALYDGEITYHDAHFGSIMEGLERRGLADETIVVFTADHGEEFFDHDSVGHGHSVFEEIIRVPLIVRIPGVTDGALRLDDAVGLVDVIPTIYEALGRPVPGDLSGESFLPQLRGISADAPRITVTGFMDNWRAINLGRWKMMERANTALYDLAEDPHERTDLTATRPIALRYVRGMMGLYLSGAERPREHREIRQERLTIDRETREQLEALGYAGASRPGHSGNE